jgi:hypothetical protein
MWTKYDPFHLFGPHSLAKILSGAGHGRVLELKPRWSALELEIKMGWLEWR